MTSDARPGFPYKTPPFAPYQRDIVRTSAGKPYHFLAMEQGTGKTWTTLVTAAFLYLHGKIDAMIVLAPNGIHAQWAIDQVPAHMPDAVPWRTHIWRSGPERTAQKKRTAAAAASRQPWVIAEMAKDMSTFPILCVNSEAVTVALAKKAIRTMLTRRRVLLVVDESGDFTTPSAKRTRALMLFGKMAPYRRCLDGTPVGTSPFELYAPYRFLSPGILGYRTFGDFKEAHAEWDTFERGDNGREFKVVAVDRKTGKKKWKDLDVLAKKIAPYTSRITKAEALPFLPAKQFSTRYFEMTAEQWRLTHELMEEMQTTLASGQTVTATNVLTQYLRYQQIACGYVPPDHVFGEEDEPVSIIPGPNPRLEMAVDEVRRERGKPMVIWTRFQYDIDLLAPILRDEGMTVGVYDGRVKATDRDAIKAAFQRRELDVFLGNPAAGGRGLDLFAGEFVLYYANYFGLRRRLQSEDRTHRIGSSLTQSVRYRDLLGLNSIDMLIVRALRNNQEVADRITGDPAKEWI